MLLNVCKQFNMNSDLRRLTTVNPPKSIAPSTMEEQLTMSTAMLDRISAAVNAESSTHDAVRAILDVCREFCGISYEVDLDPLLRIDAIRLGVWLACLGAKCATIDDSTIRSWLFGIQTVSDDDGISSLQLELEGHVWTEWDDETYAKAVWFPCNESVTLESVNKLYRTNNEQPDLDYHTQSCAEYTLCLGVGAALVRAAIQSCPPNWPTGKNVYVCWAGGDYVKLRV